MIAIIDYEAGNISSVQNSLRRLNYESITTRDLTKLQKADKYILPGVGEASSAMSFLKKNELDVFIKNIKKPILGICLGMQLMCKSSEEGNCQGLGIFDTQVKEFPPEEKVPHMGWNELKNTKGELFQNIQPSNDVYFVHSYFAEITKDTVATCDYIVPFSAALQKNNFYATQFHPEKSAHIGEQILKNFLEL